MVVGDRASPRDAIKDLQTRISTGNALPVLSEVRAALEKLLATGETTTIDLHAIPFAGGDERLFDEILGAGEVSATLETLGKTLVQETGIPGVWRVDHFDQRGETMSRFVEVTFIPEILKTQRDDAEDGLARLAARLDERAARSN